MFEKKSVSLICLSRQVNFSKQNSYVFSSHFFRFRNHAETVSHNNAMKNKLGKHGIKLKNQMQYTISILDWKLTASTLSLL